jgi:hypothetical protein
MAAEPLHFTGGHFFLVRSYRLTASGGARHWHGAGFVVDCLSSTVVGFFGVNVRLASQSTSRRFLFYRTGMQVVIAA